MNAKLVYIVSAGHSGSTLLDLVIGSMSGCFSTGELTWLPWQIYRGESAGPDASPQKLCGCGKGFRECEAWSQILETINAERNIDVFRDPFSFKINLLQDKKFERSPLLAARTHRMLYSLASRHQALSPLIALYSKSLATNVNNNWLLFDTISNCIGAEYIVDSSKSIERFSLLHNKRPSDTFLIILTRDVRAIAYSDQKRGLDPIKRAKGWARQYDRIYTLMDRIPNLRHISVKYEELVGDPEGERLRIARFIGNENVQREFQIDTRETHTVAGNKMRYDGLIEIRTDAGWKTGLSDETLEKINTISDNLQTWQAG